MNKNKRICIISGHGFHNWGDDAQLYNNVRLLKEKGYKSLFIMSPSSYIAKLCGVKKIYPSFHNVFPKKDNKNTERLLSKALLLYFVSLDYKNRKNLLTPKECQLIEFLSKMYVIFVSGSGTINTRTLRGLLVTLMPCLLAKRFKKRIIFSGQGMLPLDNYKLESFISYVLNQGIHIITRDFELGKKELKRINIDTSKLILGVDDAFTTPPIKTELIIPENTVAINVSCFIKPNLYNVFYNVAKLLKQKGYNPVFNYFQSDRKAAERCSNKEFPIYSFNSSTELSYFYHNVVGSIGMRYHSAIFGLAGNKPVINIYLDEYQKLKMQAIQEETKIPNFILDGNKLTAEHLFNTFVKALQSQPSFLEEINKNWRQRANLGVELLDQIEG